MIKKYFKEVVEFFSPLTVSFIEMIYLGLLYTLNYKYDLNILSALILFIPLVVCEYSLVRMKSTDINSERIRRGSLSGSVFIFILYAVFLMIQYAPEGSPLFFDYQLRMFLRYPLSYHLSLVFMTIFALPVHSLLSFILFFSVYYLMVVRKKLLRQFVCILMPVAMLIVLEHIFYGGKYNVGAGVRILSAQKGVEVLYGADDFSSMGAENYDLWNRHLRMYPRDIYVDDSNKHIIALYTPTIGREKKKRLPCLVKMELDTDKMQACMTYPARNITVTDNSVIIAPWFEKSILVLDRDSLEETGRIPLDYDLYPYKVRDILYDRQSERMYVSYDMDTLVQVYDYRTGELVITKDLDELSGGNTIELWRLVLSEREQKLYMIVQASPKADIVVLRSEDMSVDSMINMDVFAPGTMLYLDDENSFLYFQDGLSNDIFEIDIRNTSIRRRLHSYKQSNCIVIDSTRNCLYAISYFYGMMACIDLKDGEKQWEVKVGGKPYGIAMAGKYVYINSMVGIVRVDVDILGAGR